MGVSVGTDLETNNAPKEEQPQLTQLTLGVETAGGVMSPLIPRHTPLPSRQSQRFSLAAPDQTTATIRVLQGERRRADDNHLLGTLEIELEATTFPFAPQVEVAFEVDADGVLYVSARELGKRAGKAMIICACSDVPAREVERRVAAASGEQDALQNPAIEARTLAEQVIRDTENSLACLKQQACNDACRRLQERIERRVGRLRAALAAGEEAAVKSLTADLQQDNFLLTQLAYGRSPAETAARQT